MNSLEKRYRDFIFEAPFEFEPVERSQIKGADKILEAVDEAVDYLLNFRQYDKLNVDLGAGMLLYGPKGSGKTYLARYLATASRTRFVDLRKVPLDAEAIEIIYACARKYVKSRGKPIILFYDEFDKAEDGIADQLRLEIDGIKGRTRGVFLVLTAAVDDFKNLDEGLFRPGRISIQIPFGYFTRRGILDLFRYYISLYPHESRIDLESIAGFLNGGTTPAAVKQYVEDAYRAACMEQKKKGGRLAQKHLVERCVRELIGFPREEFFNNESRWAVACHEAGHAAVGRFLGLPVQLVALLPAVKNDQIVPAITVSIGDESQLQTLKEIMDRFAFGFGGLAAEKLLGMPVRGGISDDLEEVTSGAQEMVEEYGLGKELRKRFGCVALNRQMSEYSETIRKLSERDVSRLVEEAERKAHRAIKLIGKRRIEAVAGALFERKILLQNDLDELLK